MVHDAVFFVFFSVLGKMPRSKLGIKRPPVDSTALENAVKAVLGPENKISLREACKIFGVKLTTLSRHLSRFRKSESQTFQHGNVKSVPWYNSLPYTNHSVRAQSRERETHTHTSEWRPKEYALASRPAIANALVSTVMRATTRRSYRREARPQV